MVAMDSTPEEQTLEATASQQLDIPYLKEEVGGTVWSGDDRIYKPYPRLSHELALEVCFFAFCFRSTPQIVYLPGWFPSSCHLLLYPLAQRTQ